MTKDPRSVIVSEIMTREVATISGEATIEDAARLMLGNRISGVPVTDVRGVVVGVVTLSDLVSRLHGEEPPLPKNVTEDTVYYDAVDLSGLLESLQHLGDHGGRRVSDVMSTRLLAVSDSVTVVEAAHVMSTQRVHRVLVTDPKGRLGGIVSALDVVGFVAAL